VGVLAASGVTRGLQLLRQLASAWREIEPTDGLREAAQRFVPVHPLRAADALQLAAAYLGCEGRRPASLEFVTLDERLADAARKEGFSTVEIAVE
jgi:predicted nucleic acid-binding protein